MINITACVVHGNNDISPEENKEIQKRVLEIETTVVQPLFATIESSCGYYKEYGAWPITNTTNSEISVYEEFIVKNHDKSFEASTKYKSLNIKFNILIDDVVKENTKEDCHIFIEGSTPKGHKLFTSENTFGLGEPPISQEGKVKFSNFLLAMERYGKAFDTQAVKVSEQKQKEMEDMLGLKTKNGQKTEQYAIVRESKIDGVWGIVLQVGVCAVLQIENCY